MSSTGKSNILKLTFMTHTNDGVMLFWMWPSATLIFAASTNVRLPLCPSRERIKDHFRPRYRPPFHLLSVRSTILGVFTERRCCPPSSFSHCAKIKNPFSITLFSSAHGSETDSCGYVIKEGSQWAFSSALIPSSPRDPRCTSWW